MYRDTKLIIPQGKFSEMKGLYVHLKYSNLEKVQSQYGLGFFF